MKNFIYRNFYFLVWLYHWLWAFSGALIFWFPSRKIYVVGVTGTKGKSTVCELIAFILERAGKKAAVSSSVRNGESAMTMPGRFFLQRFLRRAVGDGCDYAIIEVTSQGAMQNRHLFIDWQAAIFTNLAPEHLEAHGGFENYREAKLRFFKYVMKQSRFSSLRAQLSRAWRSEAILPIEGLATGEIASSSTTDVGTPRNDKRRIFLINKDDANAKYFLEAARGGEIILYDKSDLPSQLAGEFNKYNIGAAAAFARSQGIAEEVIKKALMEFSGVAGRMEFVQKEPFMVVIDYAHTPDSLREVYKTLKSSLRAQRSNLSTEGLSVREIASSSPSATPRNDEERKLICVLGAAGGGRDKWKRPEMGKVAAEHCDEIILTNEDPYDENPNSILEEIEKGITQRGGVILRSESDEESQANNGDSSAAAGDLRMTRCYQKILDRKEAIKKAIKIAQPGDVVVITGKGSEKWIHLANGRKIPWSDRRTVIDLLKEKL